MLKSTLLFIAFGFSLCVSVVSAQVVVVPLLGDDKISLSRVQVGYPMQNAIGDCSEYGTGVVCYDGSATAQCPSGMKVISGGASVTGASGYSHISQSAPTDNADGWRCRSSYDSSISVDTFATCYAICVTTDEPADD